MSSGRAAQMAKVPVDKLSAEIEKILTEYGDNAQTSVNEAVKKVSAAGAKAVKASARSTFGGTGKYAAGWTSKAETGRLSAQGVIYNKSVPGLPHLLENGHANRGGGRTPGRAHIKPVEEKIVKDFEEQLREKL